MSIDLKIKITSLKEVYLFMRNKDLISSNITFQKFLKKCISKNLVPKDIFSIYKKYFKRKKLKR